MDEKFGLVEEEGFLVDFATGEVVGETEPHDDGRYRQIGNGTWVLTDEAAEATLERWQAEAAKLAGLRARRAAIITNLDAMEKVVQRRLDWLEASNLSDLDAWCRHRTAGGKSRSVRTPYGTVGLRKLPARVEITDHEAAIAWAEANDPDRVVVTKRLHSAGLATREDLPADAFTVVPPSDRCYVRTGVEADQ